MAVTSYSPLSLPCSIPDGVTFQEAEGKFAETGHRVPKNTLIRWAREKGYVTERVGRTDYVSYTDLLEVHAEKIRARNP